jgi:hypothetical protein
MTEPSQLQRIQSGPVWTDDFTITCGAKVGDGHCTLPATWFCEVHKPHVCSHPALNDAGNLELFVCLKHLEQLEQLAEKTAKQFKPPWWIKLFRDGWGECSTCKRTISHSGDILQIVLGISL